MKLNTSKNLFFALALTLIPAIFHNVPTARAATNGSIRVNGNALYASSARVTLQLTKPDASASQMRLSNNGTTWTGWKPFAGSYAWTLANYTGGTTGEGTKKVYVSFKDSGGNVRPAVLDSIIYNPRKVPALSVMNFHYDAKGNDNVNRNDEYVVIKNNLRGSIVMTGWKLRDNHSHQFILPPFALGAGKSVTIYTGAGANTSSKLYWRNGTAIWNNDHDVLRLYTADGRLSLLKSY